MNLAPFSYFNAISSEPPLVGIAIADRAGDPKDTLRNIRETGEFVVNLVSEPMLAAMARTAGEWPRGTSEFGPRGLTPAPSERVRPPCVLESPLQLECRLHREIALGNSVLVVGEVRARAGGRRRADRGPRRPGRSSAPSAGWGASCTRRCATCVKVPRPRVSRATGDAAG